MNHRSRYWILIGTGLLTVVVLIMLASSDMVFSPTITVIGSDLNKSASDEISVTTRTDFTNLGQSNTIPYDIGKWHGRDYDTTSIVKSLGANFAIVRGYDPDTFTQPLFLTIVQSKTNSSFHTLEGCLSLQGFQFQENSKYDLSMSSPDWTQGASNVTIPVNKLIITKNGKDGSVYERRLILFFYVKGNQYYSDMITLVEVEGLVPLKGPYDGTMNEEKAFLAQAIPVMFEPGASNSQWRPVIATLAGKGPIGFAGIAVLLAVPLAMIFVPFLRRKVEKE